MTRLQEYSRRFGGTASLAVLVLLAACGGSGVNSTPTPPPTGTGTGTGTGTPAPTPAPTPTPTTLSYSPPPLPPDSIGYNDTEFKNSDGPAFHGAPTAWVKGDTGQGESIAVIDTGIYSAWSEFSGRISPYSTGIGGNTGAEADPTPNVDADHGSLVALIAAGAKNGSGVEGIAYGSTIMAIRADQPGSCAGANGCHFGDVAAGITWAVDHGAAVINLSLGSDGTGGAAGDEIAAVKAAAAAGIVVVVAAGNGNSSQPNQFAEDLADSGAGNVIIVGAVTHSGNIASFSNRAGTFGKFYLGALGSMICCEYGVDGSVHSNVYIQGTSFSAPQVAGAVALLKQAFPTLTAVQLTDLLLTTAQDVGDPGIDGVYGHGILDIYAAFQPQGKTTLAVTNAAAIPLADTSAVASPAMGDALTTASLGTIVLDNYSRAFSYDLGATMQSAAIRRRLQDAIGQPSRSVSLASGNAAVAFSIDASDPDAGLGTAGQLRLSASDAEAARVLAGRVALRLSPKSQLGFAYAEGPQGLVAQLQGQDRPAFLIADRAGADDAMFERADLSLAFRRQMGPWGLTLSGESGAVYSGAPVQLARVGAPQWTNDRVRKFGLAFDRTSGALDGVIGLTLMDESRTVLGARFHDIFGGGGAKSLFVDLGAGWNIGRAWRLGGALRSGWTFADTSEVIRGGSVLVTRAWSIDLERRGLFGRRDRLGFRLAQPLRVESGGLNLELPVSYSYSTQSPTMALERLNLAPTGREIIGEIAWNGPLAGGNAMASLYYRQDPGNYAAAPDDKGMVVRWSKNF